MFMSAYTHISDRIDQVYKDLTKGKAAPMGGVAYLSLDDSEEPYNGGIKYHAMPPMKRFRDMEQLSGGKRPSLHWHSCSRFIVINLLHSLSWMKSTPR
ncbi:hypothetical protein BDP27DRAFT_610651 [Rhodocollybia butyracea]|uniref:Uncharacterized protein n=1 Tax=Rhodocollybia butyracea TaxID=206335 RepID=A0A9P5Q3I7_9AGAR|nr:hypothetical protein BDP27DRAFT_610651 [Rhodocollybia butyracea]